MNRQIGCASRTPPDGMENVASIADRETDRADIPAGREGDISATVDASGQADTVRERVTDRLAHRLPGVRYVIRCGGGAGYFGGVHGVLRFEFALPAGNVTTIHDPFSPSSYFRSLAHFLRNSSVRIRFCCGFPVRNVALTVRTGPSA